MPAIFYKIWSMCLQDIKKKPKRNRQTHARTDNEKTVYPPSNFVLAGGIIILSVSRHPVKNCLQSPDHHIENGRRLIVKSQMYCFIVLK